MEGRPALVLSLIAAMAIAAAGLYLILEQGVPILETKGDTPASTAAPPVPTPPAAPPAVAPATGAETRTGPAIYRCPKGRTITYADSPCEGGKVIDIHQTRGYEAPHADSSSPKRAAAPEEPAPIMAPAVDQPPPPIECKRLDELIASIDSEARQGGTTERAEELKERRRMAVDRRTQLRC